MPTRTRPPDLLARPDQDTPLAAGGPGQPPDRAGVAGPAGVAGSLGAVDSAGVADSLGAVEEPPWAGLRLVAVPDGWPPYDCETHGAVCPAAAPVPATALVLADAPARVPTAAPVLGRAAAPGADGLAIPSGGAAACEETAPRGEAAPCGEAAPREKATLRGAAEPRGVAEPRLAAAWPGQFGQVLVEILAGFRPAKQLAPWTTERVRAQIDLLSCAVAAEQRPRIRRVLTSRPTADVVEMTMVVSFGPRSRALAIRFERIPARPPVPGRPARPARWLCTEIETS